MNPCIIPGLTNVNQFDLKVNQRKPVSTTGTDRVHPWSPSLEAIPEILEFRGLPPALRLLYTFRPILFLKKQFG